MNQRKLAKDYLNQSKIRLQTAKRVFEDKAYAYSVRQSQEAVELALKSSLRLVGIDFPKWHDVGEILIKEQDKFPESFRSKIQKLASISEKLASLREFAMYGDESINKGPSSLFSKEDASIIMDQTEFCIETVISLFEIFNKWFDNQ